MVAEHYALPGQLLVGTDSHTPHSGALGCVAFGVGTTDMSNAFVTGAVRITVPQSLRIVLDGRVPIGVTAKDIVLQLLALPFIRSGGGVGKVFEFCGDAIARLSTDESATLTNMTAELGGFTGIPQSVVPFELDAGPYGDAWLEARSRREPQCVSIESAMDELAYSLGMDPITMRLVNWADKDPSNQFPWTTRQLREAYTAGAKAFGWWNRNPQPRSMREGRELVGYGMAAGSYPMIRTPSEAKIVFHADGRIEVLSGGTDIGTGTYTILAQTAADVPGIPAANVVVRLGDTVLPRSALAGGSQQANNLTGAVARAARNSIEALLALAAADSKSPLATSRVTDLTFERGAIRPTRRPRGSISIARLLKAVGKEKLEVEGNTFAADATEATKNAADRSFAQLKGAVEGGVSAHSWCAQFVEVRVDEDFGTIRVKRMVAASTAEESSIPSWPKASGLEAW